MPNQDYMRVVRERDDLRRMYEAGIAASAAQEREIQQLQAEWNAAAALGNKLLAEAVQLRGNLSMAEDGLASAVQEIKRLKESLEANITVSKIRDAEIQRLTLENQRYQALLDGAYT